MAAGAQFINAVVAVLDKYIVTDEKALPRPFVYAFYSCIFTGFWAVIYFIGLIPGLQQLGVPHFSNVSLPSLEVVGMSLLAAYTFFLALVSLYEGLKYADASDVMPVIGAVSAMSTFGLAYFFLGSALTPNFVWGIVLLASGTFLVSQVRFTKQIVLRTVHSGIFFALHFIAMKGLFLETNFDNGFFWSRIAFVLFALSLLLVPVYLEKIISQTKQTSSKTGWIVVGTKLIAGVAAFMLLKATDWGDVAVVQALDGLKFVFILAIGLFCAPFLPKSARESDRSTKTILRKLTYVIVIAAGFFILFV